MLSVKRTMQTHIYLVIQVRSKNGFVILKIGLLKKLKIKKNYN